MQAVRGFFSLMYAPHDPVNNAASYSRDGHRISYPSNGIYHCGGFDPPQAVPDFCLSSRPWWKLRTTTGKGTATPD